MIDYFRLNFLSLFIIIVGLFACRPLYKNWHSFLVSSLFVKIAMWLPILLVFEIYLLSPFYVSYLVIIYIILRAHFELFSRKATDLRLRVVLYVYLVIGGISLLLLTRIENKNLVLIAFTVFSSVMSDVIAFFFGNYLGFHKLPAALNNRKSWEGVLGQFMGALIGGILANEVFLHQQTALFYVLIVGAGSVFGDLFNSYVKRKLIIKDWGNSIPGHGGYVDRFSSMFGAVILVMLLSAILRSV